MRVILCAKNDLISSLWKKNLKEKYLTAEIVSDKKFLYNALYRCKDEDVILCMEDIYAGSSFDELESIVKTVKNEFPRTYIFILSRRPSYFVGRDILSLGVNGYGNSRMQDIHFQDALDCIIRGDIWVYPEFVQSMIKDINRAIPLQKSYEAKLSSLTPREQEITKLIYEGHSNKQIAEITGITLRTVKAHTSAIYEKLNVKDRVALVLWLKSDLS